MPELVFNAFVTLLVVVDPLGLAPIFVGLTRGTTEAYKREAAIRGTAIGAAILFLFAFVGQGLLGALGIGFPAFRIAGGALLFLLSLDVIFARPSGARAATVREQEEALAETQEDILVFPLTIPLIAGPGSLLGVLLTLTSLLLAPPHHEHLRRDRRKRLQPRPRGAAGRPRRSVRARRHQSELRFVTISRRWRPSR